MENVTSDAMCCILCASWENIKHTWSRQVLCISHCISVYTTTRSSICNVYTHFALWIFINNIYYRLFKQMLLIFTLADLGISGRGQATPSLPFQSLTPPSRPSLPLSLSSLPLPVPSYSQPFHSLSPPSSPPNNGWMWGTLYLLSRSGRSPAAKRILVQSTAIKLGSLLKFYACIKRPCKIFYTFFLECRFCPWCKII